MIVCLLLLVQEEGLYDWVLQWFMYATINSNLCYIFFDNTINPFSERTVRPRCGKHSCIDHSH